MLNLGRGPCLCLEILGIPSDHADLTTNANEQSKYKQILNSRAVQLVAFFCWIYVGVEVTIGGKVPFLSARVVFLMWLNTGWIVTVRIHELLVEEQMTHLPCSSSSRSVAQARQLDTFLGKFTVFLTACHYLTT